MAWTNAQLKSEITADPTSRGYMAKVNGNDYQGAADLINAVQAGVITVKRIDIAASEVLEVIDMADVQTSPVPSGLALSNFESCTQAPRIRLVNEDGSDTRILKNIKVLFLANGAAGATPQTRARLNALAVRDGSRAEQLYGTGTTISGTDIAVALASS